MCVSCTFEMDLYCQRKNKIPAKAIYANNSVSAVMRTNTELASAS